MLHVETVYWQWMRYVPFHNSAKIRLCQRFYINRFYSDILCKTQSSQGVRTLLDILRKRNSNYLVWQIHNYDRYDCVYIPGGVCVGWCTVSCKSNLFALFVSIEWQFMRRSGRRASEGTRWTSIFYGEIFLRCVSGTKLKRELILLRSVCSFLEGTQDTFSCRSIHPNERRTIQWATSHNDFNTITSLQAFKVLYLNK